MANTDHSLTPFRVVAAALIIIGLVPVANLLSAGHAVPWWSAAVRDWMVTGVGVVVLSLLLAALLRDRADALIARATQLLNAPSSRTFAIGAAVAVFVFAAILAQYCFAGAVFTGDELAQRWHAKILLSGHFSLPTEAHREFFSSVEVLQSGGHWFSQFPVGGPAVIALGLLLGVPWLVNPFLAGFTARNLYRFMSRSFDETTARTTTLLFAVSPLVLIMSASEMNHVATLAFVTLALAELPLWFQSRDVRVLRRSAMVIGVAIGCAATVRPMDAALVAVVIGVLQLAAAWRGDADRRWSLVMQCTAGAVPVAILLWANAATTGHPLLFGYDALNGAGHRPGFHVDPMGVAFGPVDALRITSGYLMRLNRYLFEWPLPAVLVIAIGLLAMRRASRWDLMMLARLAAVVVGYYPYWYDGFFAGPRFLYTAVPAFLLFTVRAPGSLAALFRERMRWPTAARASLLVVPMCVAYAWLVPTGVSSAQMRTFYYREQNAKRLTIDVPAQLAAAHLKHALVFIPDTWQGRLAARLRALGMRPFPAWNEVDSTDACALQTALDAEDTLPASPAEQRLARVLATARIMAVSARTIIRPASQQSMSLADAPPPAACQREAAVDQRRTAMPYDLFLINQSIVGGRIGGDVVFARDMGVRNELLRSEFGDRTWYEYRAPTGPGDRAPVFVPIS